MIKIIQHIDIEGPGLFEEVFKRGGYETQIIKVWESTAELKTPIEEIEAVVVLGGPMNVYQEQEYPFLKDEDEFLKEVIRRDIPTLGICLGAQLIAKAAGANIKKASFEEKGFSRIRFTEDSCFDALFENIVYPFEVFQWHNDTYDLPEDAVLLARSDACEHQAFRLKNNIYGMQFHCEITEKNIKEWTDTYLDKNKLENIKIEQQMIERYLEIENIYKKQMAVLGYNFIKIIERAKSFIMQ